MELSNICIINDMPFPTAVYKFSLDLLMAGNQESQLLHLFNSEEDNNHVQLGIFLKSKRLFSAFPINAVRYFSPRLYFQDFTKILTKLQERNGIIHYVNQSLRPIRKSTGDSVSINDNPNIVTKTNLYNLNESRRRLTGKHYQKYSEFENVMANSEYVKRSLEDYGFSASITVVPPPPGRKISMLQNKEHLRQELGLPLDRKLVLSVTNGVERKNLVYVKSVVDSLGEQYALVRIGQKVGNSFTFENVTDETVNKIYNACDVLLFPSLEEGFGIPVVEANTVGLPVVASDIEVFHEVAGNAAVFVDNSNVQNGVDGVREALNLQEELVKKGLERSKNYSIDRFNERVNQYFRKI